MTISAELQTRYSTECDIDWRSAFVLYHPSAGYRFLIDHSEEFVGLVDGHEQLFAPVPAQVTMPSLDDSGRQDMKIVWCGISREAQAFLDAAIINPKEPVICRYTIFILGNPTPQIDPWIEFHLEAVAITEDAVAVTASRTDILNKIFPSEVYRLDKFPGLRR